MLSVRNGIALYCNVLCCIGLCFVVLYGMEWHRIALHCIPTCCAVLCCVALCCVVLSCMVWYGIILTHYLALTCPFLHLSPGLTSSMFIRDTDEQPVGKPDPSGGLYIRTRKGPIVKVNIPEDHIAYQLGEVVQIQSGGLLQATPHCVKSAGGPAAQGVSRNTFAVFMQPGVSEVLRCPPGIGPEEVGVAAWKVGQTFGEFAELRFSQYYG